ncbi:hypothetical protein [Paenibacillus hamazuiensis]|uniref:hypothetical protein n=1 Tax=Paenibacillus hamazuiensis TaxID=2936508 RepID=UPI0020109859|nr:hypothetical protein [Paenibacillus hamazuiensis]
MKLSKKTVTALTFTIGACVFISTAFADMALGTGYDRLKSSVKTTAAQMEKGLDSYTMEALFTLKDNNKTLLQGSTYSKVDTVAKARENSTSTQYTNGETSTDYSYSDPKMSVWKVQLEDKYYVTEYPDGKGRESGMDFRNPFNEKGAPEVEKIVDAFVGGLKDYVQVEEKQDGGKMYSGSLSEAQVPAVVNAVSSFVVKKMISEQSRSDKNVDMPEIDSDIFVKKMTGSAVENKNGLLENMTGDIVLSGKDKKGNQHDLTLNVVLKLSDVGKTKIVLPDLTGANVEKVSNTGGFSSKFVGKYKNDIVAEKDGKFVKIGERTLEITNVTQDKVTGKYSETVKPGFQAQHPDTYNFTFEYNPNGSQSIPTFTYTNAKGEQEQGQIHPSGSGKVFLELGIQVIDNSTYHSNGDRNFDGELYRVFEE